MLTGNSNAWLPYDVHDYHGSTISIDFEVMNRFHEWAYSHMSTVSYEIILIVVAGASSIVYVAN